MNEEIVRALLRVKHAIKDNVLTNADLVDGFLKDMFPDDKYVGDRMLLLTLMREGLPLKAREGRLDDETALNAEARRIAQTYHMDEDWVRKALLVWRYVAQADESTTASGHVNADFLQLLSGFVPELKKVEASPVSNRVDEGLFQPLSDPSHNLKEVEASPVLAPQTSGGGRKRFGLLLLIVLLLAGLAVWQFGSGASSSSSSVAKRNAVKSAQNAMPDDAFLGLCIKGRAEEVRKVLASGANVHARDNLLGKTALMWAAGNNPKLEVVNVLLVNGADIHARDKVGMTALMWAAASNPNPGVVKTLRENGADIRARDKGGHDALWWAQHNKEGGKEKIIQILNGTSSVQGTMSDDVFLELCQKGTARQVRKALASGANVHAKNNDGVTALMAAAILNPNPEVAKVLLAGGANVHARDNLLGKTALMWAAEGNPNPEVVKVLLAGGADIHAGDDKFDGTALMYAALTNSNLEVVKVLLASGADIHARNKNGITALMHAAWNNSNPEVVKMLLTDGADVRAVDKNGHDALWYAQQREQGGKEKIIQILKGNPSVQGAMPDNAFIKPAELAASAKVDSTAPKKSIVQVASFKDKTFAERLAQHLQSKGLAAKLQEINIPQKGVWYRVIINAADRNVAEQIVQRLKEEENLNGQIR